MINANSDTTNPYLHIFMAEIGLYDAVKHHNPKIENQATYIWVKKRLDYILVSENVLHGSTGEGHTPFGYPFLSDHRGLYIDIPVSELFDTQPENPIATPQRGLQYRTGKIYEECGKKMRTKEKSDTCMVAKPRKGRGDGKLLENTERNGERRENTY